MKHPENTNSTCFEAFWEILENPVLGWKIWFSAQISNYAKILWNTQKTPTKHVLRLFKKFSKIRFSAQTSGSRLRCRTMLKIPWNTQKTPTKHVLKLFKKFSKIRFSEQKSGSRPRCRTMLKILWNTKKHQLNTLWHFKKCLKIRFLAEKSGSRLRCRIMLKIPWNTQKTPPKLILNNLLAMLRSFGQPTLFIILQMICTDQNWGSCQKVLTIMKLLGRFHFLEACVKIP